MIDGSIHGDYSPGVDGLEPAPIIGEDGSVGPIVVGAPRNLFAGEVESVWIFRFDTFFFFFLIPIFVHRVVWVWTGMYLPTRLHLLGRELRHPPPMGVGYGRS